MDENFAVYPTKLGNVKIVYTDSAVMGVSFTQAPVGGVPNELSETASKQIQEYFAGLRREFDLPIAPEGTVFQQKVWRALRDIPYGQTRTYKEVAVSVGNPGASRAVGMANNKNPIAIVIPCHRVIGANGKLVGYAGGLERKRALLELERGVRAPD